MIQWNPKASFLSRDSVSSRFCTVYHPIYAQPKLYDIDLEMLSFVEHSVICYTYCSPSDGGGRKRRK